MRYLITVSLAMLLIIVFTTPAALAGDECGECGICIDDVSFKMGGNFQSMLLLKVTDDDTLIDSPVDQFRMGRARLFLKGKVLPENFYFVTKVELTNEKPLLDFKFIYAGLPLNSYISFGRFKPNFTYYMPRNTAKLDFIHYPLMVWHFGMNWQMGAQTTSRLGPLKVNLGVFNGQDIHNNFSDNNKYKDFLFRGDFMMPLGPGMFELAGYGWVGTSTGTLPTEETEKLAHNRYGFFTAYAFGPIRTRFEYITTNDKYLDGDDIEDYSRSSYYFQVGYKFWGEKMEFLFRYEMYDPKEYCQAIDDPDADDCDKTWMTFGLNYYLNEWKTMLYLNYVMRDVGDDYYYSPAEAANYRAGKNDMLLLQAQMAF